MQTATDIVLRDLYGSAVALIANYMSRYEASTLHDIMQGTRLPYYEVRNSLLFMIQHQLVKYHSHRSQIHYKFLVTQASNLIRLATYMNYVYESYGDIACLIILQLLKLGSAPFPVFLDSLLHSRARLDGFEKYLSSSLEPPTVREIFVQLITENLIKAFIPSEESISEKTPSKQTAKKSKVESSSDITVQSKVSPANLDTGVFCVHTAVLDLYLLKQTAECFIASQWRDSPLYILLHQALLSTIQLKADYQVVTHKMTFDTIKSYVSLRHNADDIALTYALSNVTSKRSDPLVKKTHLNNGEETYMFDWTALMRLAQSRIIFKIVQTRLGPVAGRLWSFLIQNQLSQIKGVVGKFWEDQHVMGSQQS